MSKINIIEAISRHAAKVKGLLAKKLDVEGGDSQKCVATFVSEDGTLDDSSEWKATTVDSSDNGHEALFNKLSRISFDVKFLKHWLDKTVRGSGTSGYIAKFDGEQTITNGPKFGNDITKYLRNDGTWQTPPADGDTTYTFAGGVNSFSYSENGREAQTVEVTPEIPLATTSKAGLLKQLTGDSDRYLRADGTWQIPPNTTYGLSTTSASGLLRQLSGNTAQYLRGDGTWQTPPNTWRGIQNSLVSSSTTDSLSANQGRILKGEIDSIPSVTNAVYGTNTAVCSSGSIYCYKQTKTRIVTIYFDVYLKNGINTNDSAYIASGLPKNVLSNSPVVCMFQATTGHVSIDDSGKLKPWYMGNPLSVTSDGHFYGTIMYIAKD